MSTPETLRFLALLVVATTWGSMVFFATVMAPLVFTKLDADTAGRFIRQVFPVYYQVLAIAAAVAAVFLLGADFAGARGAMIAAAVAMLLVAAGFLVSRQLLMPRINVLRDAAKGGDAAAEREFSLLHRASVWINTGQMLVVVWVLWQLS